MSTVADDDRGALRQRIANDFGVTEALLGLVGGFIVGEIAVIVVAEASGHPNHLSSYATDVAGLVGLWVGFVGAAIAASRLHARREGAQLSWARFVADYGLEIRPFPDLLVGAIIGVGAQYLLVPLLELPLLPFVPHLFNRLGGPARTLTGTAGGPRLVVLAVLVCVGSPVVEELFFRGLLLRGLCGRLGRLGRFATPAAIVLTGVVFGLVHFEALQLIGLIGFGIVLGILASSTGRLGPGIAAHAAFNATAVIALVVH